MEESCHFIIAVYIFNDVAHRVSMMRVEPVRSNFKPAWPDVKEGRKHSLIYF
jgi:hypothetical protein